MASQCGHFDWFVSFCFMKYLQFLMISLTLIVCQGRLLPHQATMSNDDNLHIPHSYLRFALANLHSIRFSNVFVRFFTFLLLFEKVCAFSSAFLYVHIRTNQTVTFWTKVSRKNFFVKGYRCILKYRSYRLYTKFWNKIFIHM